MQPLPDVPRPAAAGPASAARSDGDPALSAYAPHVVILGAGFAGLACAKALRDEPVRVTVLDRSNHHLFQPLLYQVATAVLNPSDIAVPIRHVVRARNVSVLLAEALKVDLAGKRVVCRHGDVPFDELVIATGATHSYFGHDEWAKQAPGLKTIEDALEMRRRILAAFELAERETEPARQQEWLTFVVIGGGPTGVELAGALAEIARQTLAGEFRRFDPRKARVVLLEGQPRLLGALPEELGEEAQRRLEELGVEVRTGALVTSIDERGVATGDVRIPARTVLWGAGVVASPIARALGAPLDRAGRVKVTETLNLPGRDDVFVIGDLAHVEQRDVAVSPGSGGAGGDPGPAPKVVPGLAPAAMQEGRHVARAILRKRRGDPMEPFRYKDKGSFAVIGRGAAVGIAFNRLKMRGVIAWLAWLFIHLAYLIGFRNRLSVLLDWAYSFLTFRRRARLITGGVSLLASEAPEGRPQDEPTRVGGTSQESHEAPQVGSPPGQPR